MELLTEYLAKGFVTMLTISLPCVLVAAGIGLVVGILQAVTQVQEQTIAAAPKIVSVFLTIIVLGMLYISLLMDYFREGANLAFNVVTRSANYVLPEDYYFHSKPFASEMQDTIKGKRGEIDKIMKNPGKIPWSENQFKDKYTPRSKGADPRPNFIEINKMLGR